MTTLNEIREMDIEELLQLITQVRRDGKEYNECLHMLSMLMEDYEYEDFIDNM